MTDLLLVLGSVAIAITFYVIGRARGRAAIPSEAAAPPSNHAARVVASEPPPLARIERGSAAPPEEGFLALASHELRTPLTAMQLLLDRLNDSPPAELPARQRKMVERLGSSVDRLTDLVDSILYYTRIQNGRPVTSVEPFDLATLAAEAAAELAAEVERKALVLEVAKSADPVGIESDPKLVRLVIVNLVSNAVKFTDHGSVTVTASAEGDRRVVRVTDTGRGIAPAEQARIFEPFQSAEQTKNKHHPGFGLGLSLARYIIESLGGKITLASQIGSGSTFELSLPAVCSVGSRSSERAA